MPTIKPSTRPTQRTKEESAALKARIRLWWLSDREEHGERIGRRKFAEKLGISLTYLKLIIKSFKQNPSTAVEVTDETPKPESWNETVKRVLAESEHPPMPATVAPPMPNMYPAWSPAVRPLGEVNDVLSPHVRAMTYQEWERQSVKPDHCRGFAPVYKMLW